MIGDALRRRRVELGLTQQDLAEKSGISARTIGKIEQGKAGPSKSARRLATVLGLDPETGSVYLPIRVCLLGPLVVRPEEPIAQKQRLLLGLLALHNETTVSRDEIVELLWGRRPPASWRNLVHTYVTRLRKALGSSALVTVPGGYRMSLRAEQLDVAEFEALAAADEWAAALDQWRGPLLADLSDDIRQQPAAVALRQRRIDVALAYADTTSGYDDVVRRLSPLVSEEPLHEELLARFVVALAASGRQAEAITRYVTTRDRLATELGVDPGAELQQAYLRVLRQDLPVRTGATGPSLASPPAQLPADVFGFTGRSGQLEALDSLLAARDSRPPTAVVISAIAGTGGVGKTALALRWAHRVKEHFPDGQLYVNLRGYDPDEPVAPADALAGFLRALGVDGHAIPPSLAERSAQFRSLISGRRILVVLDNVRTAEVVRPLLPGASGAFVVITSRNALNGLVARDGAHRMNLDVLGFDEARALLDTLIGQRVRAEPESARVLIDQCARLPLALRLVADLAACCPNVSLAQLACELADERDRLWKLGDEEDPYAAIGPVLSWSYTQLSDAAAALFRLLGVLPNDDVDVRAVAALLDQPVDAAAGLLDELVNAHMLEEYNPGRFGYHDLLRAYAREKAAEIDAADVARDAVARLIEFYLEAAGHAVGVMARHTEAAPEAMAWLEIERPNLIAMTKYAAGHGWLRQTGQLSNTLQHFLDFRCYYDDASTMYGLVLEAARHANDVVVQSRAQFGLGLLHWRQARYRESLDDFELALKAAHLAGARNDEGAAHNGIGIAYGQLGPYPKALEHHLQALAIGRAAADARVMAHALRGAGHCYLRFGRIDDALACFRETIAILEGTNAYRDVEGYALHGIGLAYWRAGRYQDALDYHRRAVRLARDTGYAYLEGQARNGIGHTLWRMGRYAEAADQHERALALAADIGSRAVEGNARGGLGRTCQRTGAHEQALEYLRQARALATEIGNRDVQTRALNDLGHSYQERERYPEALSYQRGALTAARQIGEVAFEADPLNAMATILRLSGEPESALEPAREALRRAEQIGDRYEFAHANENLAEIHQDLGRPKEAQRHWRAALDGYTLIDVPEADILRRRVSELTAC
jgi:DNA-binding SARP family transcriptional activator/tetratricopeptide (TPR) repeat protein/DNA-binding XRE family transcriptional regulator